MQVSDNMSMQSKKMGLQKILCVNVEKNNPITDAMVHTTPFDMYGGRSHAGERKCYHLVLILFFPTHFYMCYISMFYFICSVLNIICL